MRTPVLPQASLGWLIAHEIRLGLRAVRTRTGRITRYAGYAMLAAYIAFGCFIGWSIRDESLAYVPMVGDVVLAISVGAFFFMVTQAMLGSQLALYGRGDLDLLLTAPLPERTVLRAKLAGIAGTITLTYAVLVLPLVLPVAILGHPALLGVVALLASLALVASCLGLGLTLLIARVAGPRAARTAGQIAAALIGGALFLVSQLYSHHDRLAGRGAIFMALFKSRIGEHGAGALPGRAVFGDPLAIVILLGGAVLLFAATGALFQRWFLSSFQAASQTQGRAPRSHADLAGYFRPGLFGAVFRKEFRLLQRDPALVFQILLRVIYLAPIALAGMGGRHPIPFVPGLALASVLVVGQLAASFAWLTISAEDAPDLIAVAPVEREQVEIAKLGAALAIVAPLGLILPIVVATQTIAGALVTVLMTAITGALAGLIELKLAKPSPRASFNRRRSGGAVAGILSGVISLVMAGITGLAVYALG